MITEEDLEVMQSDPLPFVCEVLGGDPWPVQQRILRSVWSNRHTAVPSCHASGKTWTVARVMLAFLYAFPGARVIATAPTDRQVKSVLWPEFSAAWSQARTKLGGDITTEKLTIEADWFALAFAASAYQPDRFQGFHADHILVVIDEASGVPQTVTDQIAGILSGGHARQVQIGNPISPLSSFRDACSSPDFNVIPIDAFETPNFTTFGITEEDIANDAWVQKTLGKRMPYPQLITPEWAAEAYRRWGPKSPSWQARVRGRFPDVVEHAIYGEQLRLARAEGRIGRVAHETDRQVVTGWDLGLADKMSIWFAQTVANELHLIDYLEGTGQGLAWYAAALAQRSAERGYIYRAHYAPHDIEVQELGSGKTRLETAARLGIRFTVVPKGKVADGIEACRNILGRTHIDAERCKEGLAGLSSYRYEMDDKLGVLSDQPLHDWASDPADGLRTLVMGLQRPRVPRETKKPDYKWVA